MHRATIILTVSLMCWIAPTHAASDEQRLLRDWGMYWTDQGRLELKQMPSAEASADSVWQPDMGSFDERLIMESKPVQPIIIRSN